MGKDKIKDKDKPKRASKSTKDKEKPKKAFGEESEEGKSVFEEADDAQADVSHQQQEQQQDDHAKKLRKMLPTRAEKSRRERQRKIQQFCAEMLQKTPDIDKKELKKQKRKFIKKLDAHKRR